MNDLRGAFRVLQVVNATTNTITQNNTSTYADTTLTASITPTATSSKVLVNVHHGGCGKVSGNATSYMFARLLRGATELIVFEVGAGFNNVNGDNYFGGMGCTYLDSPATTSSTTYKTQIKNNPNAAGVIVQGGNAVSTITLMEISA